MINLKRQRAGFTLIELLVVVIIIGILAGVGVQNINAATDKARNSSVISGTRSIFLGVESWKSDNPGKLPTDLIGNNPAIHLAAGNDTDAALFVSKYTPGAMLPMSPWASKPQKSMDPDCNALSSLPAAVRQPVNDPQYSYSFSQGVFLDAKNTSGAGGPPPAGEGTSLRTHYGYFYYYADANTGRYALFGVGKKKKSAEVFAVKTNFQ